MMLVPLIIWVGYITSGDYPFINFFYEDDFGTALTGFAMLHFMTLGWMYFSVWCYFGRGPATGVVVGMILFGSLISQNLS